MLGVIFGLHHKLECEERNLRDKHKLHTTSNDELRGTTYTVARGDHT